MSGSKRLRALAARQQRLNEKSAQLKREIVKQIVLIMAEHGIDWSHIREEFHARSEALRPKTGRYAKRPIRYVDPNTGDKWSGVGLLPRWLKKRIAEGHSQEEFMVSAPHEREGGNSVPR